MSITWSLKKFEELTNEELYEMLRLRTEIFVVEQNCVFQDMDKKDQKCWHLLGMSADDLLAYTRLVPPGISYKEPAIGRVVTAQSARGGGIGRQLMKRSIDACQELFGNAPIRIGAQLYLKKFYESLGFIQSGEGYLEDGIPHIEMIRA